MRCSLFCFTVSLFCAIVSVVPIAYAQSSDAIGMGITAYDIDHDGHEEMIIRARRDNFNAHSYDVISFYKKVDDGALKIIPFERSDGGFDDFKPVISGAECLQSDLRLIAGGGALQVIFYKRLSAPEVDVYRYHLAQNKESLAGIPAWYFALERADHMQSSSCDFDDFLKISIRR